jgi:hypothetical protein
VCVCVWKVILCQLLGKSELYEKYLCVLQLSLPSQVNILSIIFVPGARGSVMVKAGSSPDEVDFLN